MANITIYEKLKEFYVENNSVANCQVSAKKLIACGATEEENTYLTIVETQLVEAGTTAQITIFPSDGNFVVSAINGLEDDIPFYAANYFPALFESTILFTGSALCGTSICSTANKCSSSTESFADNSGSKLFLYYSVSRTKYDSALNTAMDKTKCKTINLVTALEGMEEYLGLTNIEAIRKIEIAFLYLGLYNTDIQGATTEEIEEIKTIYNYTNIKQCIAALGVSDCEVAIPVGTPHTPEIWISNPLTALELGNNIDVTASFRFTANGDTFTGVTGSNLSPSPYLSEFDGSIYSRIDTAGAQGETDNMYYIDYTYTRGENTLSNRAMVPFTSYPPQFYGGTSTTVDFANGSGEVYVTDLHTELSDATIVYSPDSDGSSFNTGVQGNYIWWVTSAPIRFWIGTLEVPTGPWATECDPTSYAIIHKTCKTYMKDNVNFATMHYYRTCPLQSLDADQSLSYIINT
jgi:hypothetical protein